ncbi:MAG: cache domain-containing protein, partial [Candidatus Binatia bacterium]
MFTAHKVRPLLLVATPLLVILAVLVLYYLSYVRDRERYFAERYLRALSVLSEQTEGALEGLRSAFDNATYESRRAVDGNKPTQLSPKDQLKVVKVVQDQLALIPDFDISPQTKKETKKGHQCRDETEIIVGPHSVEPRQTTTRHNRGHLSSTKLLFCFSAQEVGSVTLANLLERLIADSPLGDVDVFVIDGSGRLLFRRGTTGLQFVGFPSHAKRPNAGGDPAPHNSTEHLPVVENLQHSAFISKVVLSETTYTLFTQPLRMDMRDSKKTADSSGDSSATWVVGALIPSHRLTRDTRAISLAAMSVLPLLFLFALLSLPALKIWRMNARERLRAVDIYLLGISIVVITALAVMLLLAWYEYGSLSRDLDTEMREVSHRLRRNFAEEMGAAHMVLKRFIEVRTGSLPLRESAGEDTGPSRDGLLCTRIWSKSGKCISRKSQDGPAKSPVKMPLTKRGQKAAQTASQRPLAPPSDISQAWKEYPYFEMLVLADADGRQREKWTVRNTTTPLINISTHSSFLDPHEGRLWFGPFPDDRFALNVVASPNTGETLVILSVGAPYSEPSGIRKVGIASMVLDPISLLEPVLAPGMGFAVIESDGPVLFHSNQQRRLYENFYAEIDNSHALRSAVLARRAAGMNVVYHGRPHRFYVAPIKDTPWSLLIFRDRELLRALNVEM